VQEQQRLVQRDAEFPVLIDRRHFCGIQKSDGRRFVDGAFPFFEMLDGVQQFTGAGITLEGVQTSFNLMGVGRFAWCLEILNCRGQNQSGTGGYNQTEKTIEVGE